MEGITSKKQVLVSILMPAYNCERFVKEAIDCILNQTHTNWELLIADDASRDKTRKTIDGYNDVRIKRFHNTENLGYLKTWNKLIAEAKGEYITFLDADDTCTYDRLELLLNAFETDKSLGAVGSNYQRIDKHGAIKYTSDFALLHDEIVAKIPAQFDVVGSGLMIKREVYETIGCYNEFFNRIGAEDYYWIYLITEKFKIANIKKPLYNYRFNENSVMGNLSLDPKKLFISEVIKHVIKQRKESGTDDIAQNNTNAISLLLENKLNEIGSEEYQLYHYIAKRRFYEGHKSLGISTLLKAIKIKPNKLFLYKDLFYFLKG